jgi:superfamily II DNA helicase RecQ
VSIHGSLSPDEKVRREELWRNGDVPVLLTKALVFGFGMNWQHCARMVFLGMNDSYEQYYQAIRRCWRFGQARPVEVYVIVSDAETEIVDNVRRKEVQAADLSRELIANLVEFEQAEIGVRSGQVDYLPTQPMTIPSWLEANDARVG